MTMPAEFFGTVRGDGASCGICLRKVTVPRDRELAHQELRAEGWTWRTDTGWTCPCRHRCPGLDPDLEPKPDKRPRTRRHRSGPSPRTRRLIRKRNRREIE